MTEPPAAAASPVARRPPGSAGPRSWPWSSSSPGAAGAIERGPDLAEPLRAQLTPVRELVASIPAPRCDHCQHEDPALAQQVLIDTRIVRADFLWRMGEVELDRPTATRLE